VTDDASSQLDCDGVEIVRSAITVRELRAIQRVLCRVTVRAGDRRMLNLPWCAALAARLRNRIAAIRGMVAVQCTLFEKRVESNWLVAAHQDLMLPSSSTVAQDTNTNLRLRRGTATELERIVAVRCHIDDCCESDGALRTKLGSHRLGILRADEVSEKTEGISWRTQTTRAGDVLLMKPLTVHASSKSTSSSRRRVLHFVFA
jgi:ectoine hydroxylase-related dioxygenase (phytanoyl-CoA dioxygenase family)